MVTRLPLALCVCALTGLAGCLDHELEAIELGTDSSSVHTGCYFTVNDDVDVLFVVDNSSSMADEQAKLARSFGAFVDVLEDAKIDYRVGVTTTDNGSPWCPSASTTPEAGNLVLESCRERLDAFVVGEVDARAVACKDVCALEAEDLEILPTKTERDLEPTPRPWIERIDGRSNLPEATDLGEALACFGPQGLDGCGFEAPLESMYLALLRSQTADEASYGFLRTGARLAVVFLTDEVDCSYDKQFAEIFDAEGERAFWSDPESATPTSALCWNAGVTCTPSQREPGTYEACVATNKGVDGSEGVADEDAVMHPLSRYRDLLGAIEDRNQQYRVDTEVLVTLIAGLGPDGAPIYADGDDPEFHANFGIGPGCEARASDDERRVTQQAAPPVRMLELAQDFGDGDNLASICESDYEAVLAGLAQRIETDRGGYCYWDCVADREPETPTLEPECRVERSLPGGLKAEVPPCRREGGVYVLPSEAADVCYGVRSDDPDDPLTPTTSDDLTPACADYDYNLEFEFVTRPGLDEDTLRVGAVCTLADFPAISCPGLGY